MIGQTLSKFRVLRRIGQGGMATVYLGEHELIGTKAAIKVLLPAYCQDQQIVNRFFNEARAAGAIKHPGIIEIYDFGYHDSGTAYIIMEHVEGESLRRRLRRLGRLPLDHALSVTRHVASCLTYAHQAGIVHRDLKPGNIMLTADADVPGGERVKLLDFGIAKLLDQTTDEHTTRAGSILGTPSYMAPEQSGDASTVDSRADLYALGCVTYELLCGEPPFPGTGIGELLVAHRTQPVRPLQGRVANLPLEVDRLVLHLLEKEPGARIQTAPELVRQLDQLIAQSGLALGTAPGSLAHANSVGLQPSHPEPAYPPTPVSFQVGPEYGPPASTIGQPSPRLLWPIVGGIAVAAVAAVAITLSGGLRQGDDSISSASDPDSGTPRTQINPSLNDRATSVASVPPPIDASIPTDAVQSASAAPPVEATPDASSSTTTIKIRSKPSRALVFKGTQSIGRTPLVIALDEGETQQLIIRAHGYLDRKITLKESEPSPRVFKLRRPLHQPDKPDKPDKPTDQSHNPF